MSQPAAIGDIIAKFRRDYWVGTPTQIKILDSFLAYVALTGLLQFAYCALVGTFPFNSFLSGLFSTIGVFVLTGERAVGAGALRRRVGLGGRGRASRAFTVTPAPPATAAAVSLRLQLTDAKEFKGQSQYQAFAEYIACCVVLFLAVLNFMG
jgi:hypothetical protein